MPTFTSFANASHFNTEMQKYGDPPPPVTVLVLFNFIYDCFISFYICLYNMTGFFGFWKGRVGHEFSKNRVLCLMGIKY